MQVEVGLLDKNMMPILHNHSLGYRHNLALFYQLLDSNLFTHRRILMLLREATSETYGPWVYFTSYKFPVSNSSLLFILQSLLFIYTTKIPKIFILLSLSDLTFASNREGIDNPFIALDASCLIVCAGIRWLVRCLLLDWYLGSQTEGNTYLYLAASPFPLQGRNQRKLKK